MPESGQGRRGIREAKSEKLPTGDAREKEQRNGVWERQRRTNTHRNAMVDKAIVKHQPAESGVVSVLVDRDSLRVDLEGDAVFNVPGDAGTLPPRKSDSLTGGGAALAAEISFACRCISASVVRGRSRKSRPSTRKSGGEDDTPIHIHACMY